MAGDIESYLRELGEELRGADPALVQDALFTTQEHLDAELVSLREQYGDQSTDLEREFANVLERYGSPQEVAAAYLAAETSFPPTVQSPAIPAPENATSTGGSAGGWLGFFLVAADVNTYRSLLYMLLSLGPAFCTSPSW